MRALDDELGTGFWPGHRYLDPPVEKLMSYPSVARFLFTCKVGFLEARVSEKVFSRHHWRTHSFTRGVIICGDNECDRLRLCLAKVGSLLQDLEAAKPRPWHIPALIISQSCHQARHPWLWIGGHCISTLNPSSICLTSPVIYIHIYIGRKAM